MLFNVILSVMLIWPVGQAVKTLASHAENMGSIPVRVTKKAEHLKGVLLFCFPCMRNLAHHCNACVAGSGSQI